MARSSREQVQKPSEKNLGIHSVTEFQAIIRYERARADRAVTQFALVAVDLRSQFENRREHMKLIHALRQRIRTTDVLGWLDDRTISVLLPGTDLKGARLFTANFQKQFYAEKPQALLTVYCYPEHWLHFDDNSHDSRHDTRHDGDSGFSRVQRRVEATLARSIPLYKRLFDIVASLILLLLSSPFFLILAGYIKVVSPGPVFYKQKRVGYRAASFPFLKFRTMHPNNEPHCHKIHVKDLINSDKPMEKLDNVSDKRIIPGGRILRKACLDELPQLFNVLKGDMSLVGPRPCLPYEAEEYLRWHSHRFDVMPGLTGLWQVSGKNKLTFKQMIRLDISYCQNISFWLDLKIIIRTVPTIAGLILEGIKNRFHSSFQVTQTASESESSVKTVHIPDSVVEHI